MIRVNPTHWTADFRLARALAESYASSGLSDVCFLCTGDPSDPIGRLGPLIADETIKYYPNVLGTSDRPVTQETLDERLEELARRWPDAFVIAFEAGYGPASLLGSIEITDRGLTTIQGPGSAVGDITVNVLLRVDDVLSARYQARYGRGRPDKAGLDQAAKEIGTDEPAAPGAPGESPFGREKFVPLRPHEIDIYRVRKLADTVIDGNLRLLAKIGKQEI